MAHCHENLGSFIAVALPAIACADTSSLIGDAMLAVATEKERATGPSAEGDGRGWYCVFALVIVLRL